MQTAHEHKDPTSKPISCFLALFKWLPLPEGCFRLLTFRILDQSSWLNFTLEEYDVFSAPEYDALSYACGPERPTVSIKISGACLWVTKHLWSALKALSEIDSERGFARKLWVDTICINQNDDREKASQVAMMNHFYSRAERVLIWVGMTDRMVEAVDKLEYLRDKVQSLEAVASARDYGSRCGNLVKADGRLWRGIHDLLSSPWFQRVWTLQEAVLARQKTFVCGPRLVDWQTVISLRTNLKYGHGNESNDS